jgi:hypothetical protein
LETAAEELEAVMEEQQQLIIALKSFLEDKASRPESAPIAMSSEHNMGDRENQQHSATSWPSATLPAAYFAALLLPSVVSGAMATSIVNRVPPNIKRRNLNGVGGSVFLPMNYILPGLETVDSRREVMELSLIQLTSDTSISTSAKEATCVAQDNRNESVWAKISAAKASTAKTSIAGASTAKASATKASTAKAAEWVSDWSKAQTTKQQQEK